METEITQLYLEENCLILMRREQLPKRLPGNTVPNSKLKSRESDEMTVIKMSLIYEYYVILESLSDAFWKQRVS